MVKVQLALKFGLSKTLLSCEVTSHTFMTLLTGEGQPGRPVCGDEVQCGAPRCVGERSQHRPRDQVRAQYTALSIGWAHMSVKAVQCS